MVSCVSCKKNYDNDQLLTCDQCNKKICVSCSKLTASEIKCMELRKGRILKFHCKICVEMESNRWIIDEIKELKIIINEQSSKIDSLTNALSELTTNFDKLESQNTRQSTGIETVLTEIKNNVASTKPLYAQAVVGNKLGGRNTDINEPVLIVKPKELQKSEETKKEIKEKIDPTRLGAGISGIKEISHGQVVIRCGNKEDRAKIQNKIHEEMSLKYEIKTPTLRFPKIKVVGISKDDDDIDKNLVDAIIDQNLSNHQDEEEGLHVKILKRLKQKDGRLTLILETDPKTHTKLLNKNKIFIGWSRGKAYDYVHVVRCFKCLGFNHFAKDCDKNKLCPRCSLEHEGDCKSTHMKCINCSNAIAKYKVKVKDDHNALDVECPCYMRVLNSIKRRIDYLNDQ